MRRLLMLGTMALLGACSEGKAPRAAPGSSVASGAPPAGAPALLSAGGVGSVRFGMTLAQAEQAAGGKAMLPTPFDPACSMVRLPGMPGLRFMVEQGIVTRADAESGVANALGIAVGDPVAPIRAGHPEAVLTPHKYDPNSHYLSFPGTDGRGAILVEESGGKVTRVRAGLQPAVGYVETCG